MSTANKLTYLNVTKQKLKQAINNIGGEVTDETTFRQYVEELQNVYDNYPKTSYGEGTSVTLENCNKGKLDYDNGVVGIGQSEQNGEPTPSTPITINSVTGNQVVRLRGKNEINVPEIILSGRSYIYRANIGSGNYSISITKSRIEGVTIGNQYVYMYKEIKFYDSNDTLLSTNTGTSAPSITNSPVTKVFNFTAPQNTSYMEIEFSNNNGDNNLNTLLSNVMLVSGTYNESTMPTYEPYITPTSYQLSLGDRKVFEGDYFWRDNSTGKKYHHHTKGTYTMTGEENIQMQNNNTRFGFDLSTASTDSTKANDILVLCNRFIGISFNNRNSSSTADNGVYQVCNNSSKSIQFNTGTKFADIDAFKSYCRNNNVDLVYTLDTETDEEITGTLAEQLEAWYNAQSIKGTTIITSNGNLPMIIKVRGLKGE